MSENLIPIASKRVPVNQELYKVVDFLNKTLKHKNLMFGIKMEADSGAMIISVYEV